MGEMEMRSVRLDGTATRIGRLGGRIMAGLRNQVPAATASDRRRNPLAASEAEAAQILAASWGWS
jgi:hypothetical protein